jgi:hypothetical protein
VEVRAARDENVELFRAADRRLNVGFSTGPRSLQGSTLKLPPCSRARFGEREVVNRLFQKLTLGVQSLPSRPTEVL